MDLQPYFSAGRYTWQRLRAKRRCLVCACTVHRSQCADGMCPDCDLEMQPRIGGYCPACGQIFSLAEVEPYLCAVCRHNAPVWNCFGFLGPYAGTLREMILDFKFHARFERRKILQALLNRAYSHHFQGVCPDLIVPVPLHTARLRERGFNQSLEVARGLSRRLKSPLSIDALIRTRRTKAQSGLERKERVKNVRGAFVADSKMLKGRHVLLVDDVSTTGMTLTECTRTLRRAGATQVDALVLAVAAG